MKKLFICIALCLMLIVCACGNSEQAMAEKQNVSEILAPYNGFAVMSKSKFDTRDGYICTLQLSKTVDGARYIYYVDSLPGWVWDEYDLDDTIHIEIPQAPEPEDSNIKEDTAGKKTIVIDGITYELTELSLNN